MAALITILGQKQTGKGVTATYLAKKLKFQKVAFADAIKDSFCELFGVTRQFIEEWKEKQECPPGFNVTIRKALQLVGDGFRNIKSDVWICKTIKQCEKTPSIIEDGRYPNEWTEASKNGSFNILIYRPGYLNDIDHPSEKHIRPLLDWFINNNIPEGFFNYKNYKDYPDGVELINYYLINDGSANELYGKLDKLLSNFTI